MPCLESVSLLHSPPTFSYAKVKLHRAGTGRKIFCPDVFRSCVKRGLCLCWGVTCSWVAKLSSYAKRKIRGCETPKPEKHHIRMLTLKMDAQADFEAEWRLSPPILKNPPHQKWWDRSFLNSKLAWISGCQGFLRHTVHGRNPANQLRLVYPIICKVLYITCQVVSRISEPSTILKVKWPFPAFLKMCVQFWQFCCTFLGMFWGEVTQKSMVS